MLILQILGAMAVLILLGVYWNVRDIQYRVERWMQSQFDKEESEPTAESGSYSRMYADAYDRDKQSKGQSEK